ncbi:MAG: hypothetical protein AAF653_12085, partial [Chloroflexota bacterium]
SEGRSPGEAGKDHTSHRIRSVGYPPRITLFILYVFCFIFGTIGLLMSATPPGVALRVGSGGLGILVGLFALMMWVRRRYQLN